MKKLFLIFIMLISLQCFSNMQRKNLIEVLKSTSVYSKSSRKSKRLAVAEKGTLLVFIGVKGSWLKIEDIDGMQGWLKKKNTNYKEWKRSQRKAKISKKNSKNTPLKPEVKNKAKLGANPMNLHNVLSLTSQYHFKKRAFTSPVFFGLEYHYFKAKNKPSAASPVFFRNAVSVGLLVNQNNSQLEHVLFPMRVKLFRRHVLGLMSMAPDVGALLEYNLNEKKTYYNLSIGYSVGVMSLQRGIYAKLRLGAEFFSSTRGVGEFAIGYVF